MVERDLVDAEGGERSILLPGRYRPLWELLAIGLRQHEPMWTVDELREDLQFVGLVFRCAGDPDRLTEGDRFLALPDPAPELLPPREGR